jgi:hypothetical protein
LVQFGIAELQRRLRIPRRELLAQQIGHVIGSEGAGIERLLKGSCYGFGAVLANQLENLSDLASESTIGVCQPPEIALDRFLCAVTGEQRDQAPLGLRAPGGSLMGQQLFLETFCAQRLPASPAAGITDDFLVSMVERHRGSIGFDNETLAHEMRRGTVTIAVELQTKVLLHHSFGGVAVIGSESWERTETIAAEPITRPLAGLTMQALVGDLI